MAAARRSGLVRVELIVERSGVVTGTGSGMDNPFDPAEKPNVIAIAQGC